MKPILTYEKVYQYLKKYSTTEPPYDFNGLLALMLVAVENLRKNGLDQEVLDFAFTISDEQAAFLQRLLDSRAAGDGSQEA